MKKFTESETGKNKYAGKDILRNKIYNMIDEHLSVRVDGEICKEVSIGGKTELVEKLHKFVTSKLIESEIDVLSNYKSISENNNEVDEYISLFQDISNNVKITNYDFINESVKENVKEIDYNRLEDLVYNEGDNGDACVTLVAIEGRSRTAVELTEISKVPSSALSNMLKDDCKNVVVLIDEDAIPSLNGSILNRVNVVILTDDEIFQNGDLGDNTEVCKLEYTNL